MRAQVSGHQRRCTVNAQCGQGVCNRTILDLEESWSINRVKAEKPRESNSTQLDASAEQGFMAENETET